MAKTKNPTTRNGRWLIVDTQSPSSDMVVTSLKKIEGAELRIISHKTYVRFNKPNNKLSHYAVTSKISRAFQKSSARTINEKSNEKIKHYCAVVLK